MGWFTKKKKKRDSLEPSDDEGGMGGGDRDPRDRGEGGEEGGTTDRAPNFGGSDDNPYAEDPAHKHLVKVLDSNGLVRHRRAFIRNSVYTVQQAKALDEERLKQIGVFLEADRKKLLRIFKDTEPVESTVDAEREKEKNSKSTGKDEKNDDEFGSDDPGDEKSSKSKSKKKRDKGKDKDKDNGKKDKKKEKDDKGKSKKDKSKKSKKKGRKNEEEDDDDLDDSKSKSSKSSKSSKKDKKDKSKKSKKEEGDDLVEAKSKKSKNKKGKIKTKEEDLSEQEFDDKPEKSKRSKDKSKSEKSKKKGSESDMESDFSELEKLGVAKSKPMRKIENIDDENADTNESHVLKPDLGDKKAKGKGRFEDFRSETEGGAVAPPEETKMSKSTKPKKSNLKVPQGLNNEKKNDTEVALMDKVKDDHKTLESDIELDGYESETLEALEPKPNSTETGETTNENQKRLSHGRKALTLLSEKLGFNKGKKAGSKRSSVKSEDEEDLWWKSLENHSNSESEMHSGKNEGGGRRVKMKKRTKKLAVKPEFATKVEYVTDEESNVLQDFRRNVYNGPIARRKNAPLAHNFIPNVNMNPVVGGFNNTLPPPMNFINSNGPKNVDNLTNNPVLAGNISTAQNSNQVIPPVPNAEKEEEERKQAQNLSSNSPTFNAHQMIPYNAGNYYQNPTAGYYGYNNNYSMPSYYQGPYYNPYMTPFNNNLLNNSMYYTDVTDVDTDFENERYNNYSYGAPKKRTSRHRSKPRNKKAPRSYAQNETESESEMSLGKIHSDIEYLDLSKDKKDVVMIDRDVKPTHKRTKPQKFGSDDYFTKYNFDFSGANEKPKKGKYGGKNYKEEHRVNYFSSNPTGKGKNGYESDTDLYVLRKKLAEIGASKYFPMLVKEGITSVESCDLSKLEKLPIKSSGKKSLIRAISRLKSGSKNLRTRIYNYFSGSSTDNDRKSKNDAQDDKSEGLKSAMKKSMKDAERGRSRSRDSTKNRHYFEVGENEEIPLVESDEENKIEAIEVKDSKEAEKKTVKFDLDEDDEISLPDFSDTEAENSDSDMSLYSDYS